VAGYLVRGVGSVWGAVIIAAVVPFLVYFMLLARTESISFLRACLRNGLTSIHFLHD
jgi:predicted PurR-regulated permease PerM